MPTLSSPTINLTLLIPPLNHVPKLCIYMSFKKLQGLCLSHFHGQPVPMLYNTFSEDIFPNIQSSILIFHLLCLSYLPSLSLVQQHRKEKLQNVHCLTIRWMQSKNPAKGELDGITDTSGIKLVRANCCPYIAVLEHRRHKQ